MDPVKKQLNLKYISKKRTKEVKHTFDTLESQKNYLNHLNYFDQSQNYHMPFKQFSILQTEGLIFTTTSSSD